MEIINRNIYQWKKISLFVGSPGFGETDDLINVCLKICPESGIDYIKNNFLCVDDKHPQDQVKSIESLLKHYKETEHTRFIYTNSPYVVQAVIHYSGFDTENIGIYECVRTSDNNIELVDCSSDCREIFTKMAKAIYIIMDVVQDSEQREKLRELKGNN